MTTNVVNYGWVEQKVTELADKCGLHPGMHGGLVRTWPDSDTVRAALAEAYQEGYDVCADSNKEWLDAEVNRAWFEALVAEMQKLHAREGLYQAQKETLSTEISLLKIRLYEKSGQLDAALDALKEEATEKIRLRDKLAKAHLRLREIDQDLRQVKRDLITPPED